MFIEEEIWLYNTSVEPEWVFLPLSLVKQKKRYPFSLTSKHCVVFHLPGNYWNTYERKGSLFYLWLLYYTLPFIFWETLKIRLLNILLISNESFHAGKNNTVSFCHNYIADYILKSHISKVFFFPHSHSFRCLHLIDVKFNLLKK